MTEYRAADQESPAAGTPKDSTASAAKLRSGTLNLGNVALLALGYYAVGVVIYFVIPTALTTGGANFPFDLLLGMVALVPTAVSFAALANKRPAAGSAYTWASETMTRGVGVFVGFALLTAYVVANMALQPLLGGQVFDSLLNFFGVHTSYGTAVSGGILFALIVAALTARAVRPSARAVALFFGLEAAVTFALALYFVIRAGVHGHLSGAPFQPALHGSSLGEGLVFALFSLLAIDIAAPLAEEAKAPRKMIPIAIVACLILAGLFDTFLAYGMSVAAPTSTWKALLASPSQAGAVYLLTGRYLGSVKILVIITSFTSVLALYVASVVGAGRVLHAMGKDRYAPGWLARIHPVHQTPRNAQMTVIGIGLAVTIALSIWQGRDFEAAYAWMSEAFVWFVLLFYIAVNAANIAFHWRRARRQFNWLLHGAIPLGGIGVCVWALWVGFFHAELGLPFKTGSSIVWFSLAWTAAGAVGVVAVMGLRRHRQAFPAGTSAFEAGDTHT